MKTKTFKTREAMMKFLSENTLKNPTVFGLSVEFETEDTKEEDKKKD